MSPQVRAIELHAYGAWPAAEVSEVDGWRLRFMHGVSRRANSVWPVERTGDAPLAGRIAAAERWYQARGIRPAFQVSPLSQPGDLDSALAALGYAVEAPVSIQIASARVLAARPLPPGSLAVRVDRSPADDWFEISGRSGRFAKVADVYRGLLDRIGPRARYALASVDGVPVGVGLGVIGDGAMGIFSMLTLSHGRRQGAARAVLRGLAASAVEGGVDEVYLQVERDNTGAVELYGSASFREIYGYHYRVGR